MEHAIKWYSPQAPAGSLLSAIAAHAILCAAVTVLMGSGAFRSVPAPRGEVETEYEVLDHPPEPVKEVKRMARTPQPVIATEPKVKVQSAAHELQDEKSAIAGTQAAPKVENSVGSEGDGSAVSVPYYKIKPKYPKAALAAGDEGWVLLKIDVAESGEVENIRVIDGEKRNLFQDEARRAVAKWKYKPGPRRADHQVRVDFKLQDA